MANLLWHVAWLQGKAVFVLQCLASWLGMGGAMRKLAHAQTLQEQQQVWNHTWFVKFCKTGPSWIVDIIIRFLAVLFLNRFVLW